MRARRGLLASVAVAAVLLIAIALLLPAVTLSIALASPAAAPWLALVRQDIALETVTVRAAGHRLEADLYRPARPTGAILLVHGLSRAGRAQPDLARLAGLLAREGQLVMVPDVAGLKAFRLGGTEVEEIRGALAELAARGHPTGIAGFSFGAGPALLAADGVPGLRFVGSFGGYADLANVIRFITTGRHEHGGHAYAQRALEYNRWKLLALLAGFAVSEADRETLFAITQRKLANPGDYTGALERELGDEGRSLLALVQNHRADAVPALMAALPASARAALESLSPLRAVSRTSARVLIAHGGADDSIPFTESLRLAEAAGGRARVAILQTFHHTGPGGRWDRVWSRFQDGVSLLRIAGNLLSP